jgi:hypothetical protein
VRTGIMLRLVSRLVEDFTEPTRFEVLEAVR